MALSKQDRQFRSAKITLIDFKQIDMDRVLVALLARLRYAGHSSRIIRSVELTVDDFTDVILECPEFVGFAEHREVVRRWVETHLVDMVNRGKATAALASPRPLHGYTYRFRNPKYSRSYDADKQLYELLYEAPRGKGQRAIDALRRFFFPNEDPNTGRSDDGANVDVETQALLALSEQVQNDSQEPNSRDFHRPLCFAAAELLADDVLRLLAYSAHIPRTVMVDYLKTLFAFHLGLYHLQLLKLLPALVRRRGADPACSPDGCPVVLEGGGARGAGCAAGVALLVDVAGRPKTAMARLAERSAEAHYRRIPAFVKAHLAAKKLDEFSEYLDRSQGRMSPSEPGGKPLGDVLRLLTPSFEAKREAYFGQHRLASLLGDEELPPEQQAILGMNLSGFEKYVELLVAMRGDFHRRYVTQCLDSLLLKNGPGAALAQARTKGAPRRFVLGGRLLEVLLQVLMLKPGGPLGYHTQELRLDELIIGLRERYGLHVDRLPSGDGFGEPSITDREALRGNLEAFKERLREVGFFRDLSDASVTQTVTPRYLVRSGEARAGGAA